MYFAIGSPNTHRSVCARQCLCGVPCLAGVNKSVVSLKQMCSLSAPLLSLVRVNTNTCTQTHTAYCCCVNYTSSYLSQSTYLLFSNELNIKVIAWLPAYRSFHSNSIDLFYVFFFNNMKCCDDRPALASLLPHREAQTHTYTPTHSLSFGGQRTKSLLVKLE